MPKISALPAATSVNPADLVAIVQSGTTKRAAASLIGTTARTAAEISAAVTPTDYSYEPGDIRRYGAADDAADNSTALASAVAQAAIDGGADVYIPSGTWNVTATTTIASKNNVRIYGDGFNKSAVVIAANSIQAFAFTGTCARCSVRGLWIGSFIARTNTTGILVNGTSFAAPCSEFVVEDVKVQNVNNPFVLTNLHQSNFDRIRIVQSVTDGVTGIGIHATDVISTRFRDVNAFATTGSFGNDNLRFTNDCDTILLEGCAVDDAPYGIRFRNPGGLTGSRLVRVLNCYVEASSSTAYYVESGGRDIRFVGCHAATCDAGGFLIAAGSSVQLTDCLALQNGTHGFSITGGSDIKLLGCEASNNSQLASATYDGINIATDHVRILGCRSGDFIVTLSNKQRYGLTIASGSDYIIEADNDLVGNDSGTLNLVSTEANNRISHPLTGSKTHDPGSLLDGVGETTTVTVTGAALGDYADASFSLDTQGLTITAWVSSTNTVSVRFQNETGGPLDIGSGTLRCRVVRKY